MNKYLILLPALVLTPAVLAQSVERQHGAHQHGHASLNLAVSGKELQIELESPAMNLIGFEHQARSAQDRETLEQAVARLKQPLKLIAPNAEADCELEKYRIHSSLLEDDHDEEAHEEHDHDTEHSAEKEHEHEDHGDEQHADFEVAIEFHCDRPERLTSIAAAGLFKAFPGFEELEVQWITDRNQGGAELSPRASTIKLR